MSAVRWRMILGVPAAVLLLAGTSITRAAPDPARPFPAEGPSQMLRPPYRTADVVRIKATMSGSIHSPLPHGAFFRHPAFQSRNHDGRLYYTRFLAVDAAGKPSSLGFITWERLKPPGKLAQRVVPIPRHTVEDFETDGKEVRVHHYPPWPYGKAHIRIQIYRWHGDQAGKGEFRLSRTIQGPAPE